jgi:hypothetical protein
VIEITGVRPVCPRIFPPRIFSGEESGRALWQARFYDFNVWTTKKQIEKLSYMHRNPVKRGLVEAPEEWRWSSYRHYFVGRAGSMQVNARWGKISFSGLVA